MPSSAFSKFENRMLTDVDRLIESHQLLSHGAQGRHGLGHITRSGTFLLCAAWELYIEELVVEISNCFAQRAHSPDDLPKEVRKEISKHVKQHSHELKPLDLAGDGWRQVYLAHANELVTGLNTPKAGPINLLFKKLTGWAAPADCWSCGTGYIDAFVGVRGDIAHRGSDANYVRLNTLRDEYRVRVAETAREMDNCACDYVFNNSEGNRPWRRRN
ncbi:HEPN domain-containing protein [Roseibium album]|uniref:HEPN domain-containing protein n=1 Tax=Roseibium album TaxID=311410 RepID=UPI0032EF565E